jgi:antitoxin HigA-1
MAKPQPQPPTHPGEILRLEMPRLFPDDNLRVRTLAEMLDITMGQLNDFLAGKTDVSPLLALRLGRVVGPSREWWMDRQRDYALAKAERPIRGQIAALKPLPASRRMKAD